MRLLTSAAAIALLAPLAAHAQSETGVGADVYADGGYSTNPRGSAGKDATAYARVGIRPKVTIRSARSTVELSGEAQVYQYFRNDARDDNYQARAALTNSFSEAATGTLSLDFADRVLNRYGELSGDATGNDAGLLGTRARRFTYAADGGLSLRTSARSSVTANANWTRATYKGSSLPTALSNHNSIGGSLGYGLQTSAQTTLGVQAYFTRSTYKAAQFPDSSAYGGAATFKLRLSPRWTLNGQVGATVRDLTGMAKSDVFLTGTAELCHAGQRTTLCATGSRMVGSSGISGSAVQTTAGATLTTRTSEYGTLNGRVNYMRSERATTGIGTTEYVNGSLGYDHRMSKRLQLSTTGFYRKSMGAFGRGEDYGGQVGIQYHLGEVR